MSESPPRLRIAVRRSRRSSNDAHHPIGGGRRRSLALALAVGRVWRRRRRRRRRLAATSSFAAGTTMAEAQRGAEDHASARSSTSRASASRAWTASRPASTSRSRKIIAEELGIPADKIEWTETPSAVREEVIEQGKVDIVVATYTINDKRKQRHRLRRPVLRRRPDDHGARPTTPPSPARTRSRTAPRRSARSRTRRRPTTSRSTSATRPRSWCCSTSTRSASTPLNGGQVDAVTTDNVILLGFIATNEGKFKLAGKPFTEEPYGIGLKKDDNDFRDFINDDAREDLHRRPYEKAWKDTAGKFDPTPSPTIPTDQPVLSTERG